VASYLTTYTGNIAGGNLNITSSIYASNYYYANGVAFTGSGSGGGSSNIKFTSSNTAPVSPGLGDTWYNTSSDKLYEYIKDSANNQFWLDISTAGASATTSTGSSVPDTFSQFMLMGA
jgi:hypothetical protein